MDKYTPAEGPLRAFESAVAFGLTVEDMHVTSLAHKVNKGELPHPQQGSLEDYFIFNSGDLFNGFFYAFMTDCILNGAIDNVYNLSTKILGENSKISKSIDYIRQDKNRINLTSGIISSLAISFFETTGIGNYPDAKDIPAGIAGALIHTGLRYLSLRRFKKNNPQYVQI